MVSGVTRVVYWSKRVVSRPKLQFLGSKEWFLGPKGWFQFLGKNTSFDPSRVQGSGFRAAPLDATPRRVKVRVFGVMVENALVSCVGVRFGV